MNKGQRRMIYSAKSSVTGLMSGISHGLGITTKSLSEMTAQEVKDLISDIFFEPGAIDQIDNTLNGRPDKKGPLSKNQRRTIAGDPTLAAIVKKVCVERTLSEETMGTWNNLWEGVNLSGSNVGEITDRRVQVLGAVEECVKDAMKNKRTAKGFIDEVNKIMDISIAESVKMIRRVDKAIEAIEGAPNLGTKQRAKSLKTVDVPTIPIIEKMNGSTEHTKHALTFLAGIEGKFDFSKMPSGPYTYRELAKIVMTKDSRRCMADFNKLQQERDSSSMLEMPQDDKMTAEEKQYVKDAKAAFDSSMAKASVDHKNALAQGQIGSLGAYHTKIEELKTAEMSANTTYSNAVLSVNFNISQRYFQEKLEAQRRENEAYIQMQEEHMRELEAIQARMDARAAEEVRKFLEKYGDELGLNDLLQKAKAATKGEQEGEGKPKGGVTVEQVVVDETAVKTAPAPNKNDGDAR